MSLLRVDSVTKTHDPPLILDGVSWQVTAGDRVGLIGANGTGKTTLLEIMAGVQEPTTGAVYTARGARIGYLRQIPDIGESDTVRDAMVAVFQDHHRLERRMQEATEEMAAATSESALNELLERYASLEAQHEHIGGYSYEHRINSILRGIGFDDGDFEKPLSVLSGGEKNRAALSRLLLQEPDVLLMDEPTNHLDINAIEWLESFLRLDYPGSYVVVSHDRYFLDKTTTKTVEVRSNRLHEYKGNYSAYLKQRAVDTLTNEREYEQQQKHIAKEEDFIRRHMASQRTREAQGRRKRLARLERVERPAAERRRMRLNTHFEGRSGENVIIATDLGKEYGDQLLFEDLSFDVSRGDTLGVMGPNGSGKTTLFRILMQQETATVGEARFGAALKVGYLDQEHRDLRTDRTVLNEIWSSMPGATPMQDVRAYLAPFLFQGDDIDKPVSVLSGGEKTRLALAKLLLGKPNLLLLDEPTNHLDIPSREALEDALLDCAATIVLISHDRYLLSKLATKLLVFGGDDGPLFWRYSYEEWELKKQEDTERERAEKAEAKRPAPKPEPPKQSGRKRRRKKKPRRGDAATPA
ncbi:ABC-F family ATP-binding cassette domain-containing protein [Candidatus Poribacteria bacterium]|jgi:ATP-binding cassette, subfamily F, member 3|nr:ABC-F family ATP-binding cassette domain-containing protein [Candidatus Poribacteria bacterium]MBT5713158.1 ABC-F family ATP-binding cassette domain-containing protein [Candidatus Poribacteria bacterium]MBT7097921.1 ABC-F family ATP-binding cassette domain-containing protein [Candidatus Poribacteria bacterium]MBT7805552.1 ABC-F family ATP-binding cassette domain-containing protein [Candidatus Poribacteria bacterium]